MTRHISFLGLLLLLSCCLAKAQEIVAMSYNVRYDNPDDGKNAWPKRKEGVCNLIRAKEASIVGLQEVLQGQLQDILILLPEYQYFGVGRDDGDKLGEYAPILYKKDKYHLSDSGYFWLSSQPSVPGSIGWDAACPRIVTWAKLTEPGTGLSFYFFNTHFDHVGEKARLRAAVLLKRKIRKIAGNNSSLLCGDFNCTIQSKPMRVLCSGRAGLADSFSLALERSGPAYTWSTFQVNGPHGDIIDHILLARAAVVHHHAVLDDNKEGAYFSDHLPVVIRFQFLSIQP